MQAASVTISVVCPCFNEEKVIPAFIDALIPVLKDTDLSYEIVFINDGSSDKTLQALLAVREETDAVRILNLSRNFGKEAAMTAGLDHAQGEVIIPMDVDLQDPPELIKEFIERWREGYEVVLARRVDRSADTWTKRVSAGLFYHLHNRISDVEVPHNVGDYRLFTRKVLKEVQRLGEHQRFMKGLFAWVGFNTTTVEYVREKRVAGKTHFNGWKLWNFALDGITSFSSAPLRIWLYIGICIATPSVFWASWILIRTVVYGIDLPGYASLISAVLFLGGIQLIGIGVLGEYVGRIYIETKGRPNYIVEKDYETRPSI
ncbi:MAG: glycosyltransferase family 2 protein [Halieaceae bacterium]|nr:glycosyltransferase family 2 protein [Halieaceae bacterium]